MHGPQANTGGEPELDINIVVEATTAGELNAVPVDASDRHDMVCTSRKRQACQEPKNLTIYTHTHRCDNLGKGDKQGGLITREG